MEAIAIALLAIVGSFTTWLGARVHTLEKRLNALDYENDLMWGWVREAQDQYYRFAKEGSPPFPKTPFGVRGNST